MGKPTSVVWANPRVYHEGDKLFAATVRDSILSRDFQHGATNHPQAGGFLRFVLGRSSSRFATRLAASGSILCPSRGAPFRATLFARFVAGRARLGLETPCKSR